MPTKPASPLASMAESISIAAIDVVPGRRVLDPDWIAALAEDFQARGQQVPIEVLAKGKRFRLIAGGHRLEAAFLNGDAQILAIVRQAESFASEAEIKLAEIAENFMRRELSVLDRAFDVAAWREVYEAAKGAVKRGGDRRSKQAADQSLQSETLILEAAGEAFAASFKDAACAAFKLSGPVIYRLLQIATLDRAVREVLSLHPIADNRSELVALATSPREWHGRIANLIMNGDAATVEAATALIEDRSPPVPLSPWEKLSGRFSRMKQRDQERFFELHQDAIDLWLASRGR